MIPAPLIFDDANALHEGVCEKLMFGSKDEGDIDWVHGTEVGLHNVVLGAKSFAWDFNLKRLWLPKSRWTMMVRQYIDPNALDDWREKVDDRLHKRGRGIAVLRTRMVQGRGAGRNVRRRWGSCMLNFSFRSNPIPTLSIHSRTTYFGYLAAMDITVAHAIAREAGAIVGIDPADMQFVWTLDLAQFHGFRSLAWPLMDEGIRADMQADMPERKNRGLWTPGYRKALDGYARILAADAIDKPYGDEKFSSFNRTRRRYHTEAYGLEYASQYAGGEKEIGPFPPLPDVWARDLDLTGPLAGRDGEPFEDGDDDDE